MRSLEVPDACSTLIKWSKCDYLLQIASHYLKMAMCFLTRFVFGQAARIVTTARGIKAVVPQLDQ